MKVKFILTMDNVCINGKKYDRVILEWQADVDPKEVIDISHNWVTDQGFLTKRMIGLTDVGEANLNIEPVEI